MSRKVLLGIVVGALAIAGYLYWVNQGNSRYAAVGDCVSSATSAQLVHVACDSSGALRVLAKFAGDDSNQCDAVSATTHTFIEYPKGSAAFVLCAGTAK